MRVGAAGAWFGGGAQLWADSPLLPGTFSTSHGLHASALVVASDPFKTWLLPPSSLDCLQATAFHAVMATARDTLETMPSHVLEPLREWLLKVGGPAGAQCRQLWEGRGDRRARQVEQCGRVGAHTKPGRGSAATPPPALPHPRSPCLHSWRGVPPVPCWQAMARSMARDGTLPSRCYTTPGAASSLRPAVRPCRAAAADGGCVV